VHVNLLSLISEVLKSRTEGMGINDCARIYEISKNTILNWERRFAKLKQVLFLYSLGHTYLQTILEVEKVKSMKDPMLNILKKRMILMIVKYMQIIVKHLTVRFIGNVQRFVAKQICIQKAAQAYRERLISIG